MTQGNGSETEERKKSFISATVAALLALSSFCQQETAIERWRLY